MGTGDAMACLYQAEYTRNGQLRVFLVLFHRNIDTDIPKLFPVPILVPTSIKPSGSSIVMIDIHYAVQEYLFWTKHYGDTHTGQDYSF